MRIFANGKQRELPEHTLIGELLEELKLAPMQVFIEHNGEPLERKSFASTALHDGDRLEIVQMVGGG